MIRIQSIIKNLQDWKLSIKILMINIFYKTVKMVTRANYQETIKELIQIW
jgi:hypothetical protein